MFGGIKDMSKLLKQAQEMKAKMKKIQKELRNEKITVEAQNGMIKIVINGEMEFEELNIMESWKKSEDSKKVDKAIREAVNTAIEKAKAVATSKLGEVTGGLNIPGLT